MNGTNVLYNYTSVGDVITIVICIILLLLLRSTYTVRKRNIILFRAATYICILAAVTSITYHSLLDHLTASNVIVTYIIGDIFHISLIAMFIIFNEYLSKLINLSNKEYKVIHGILMVAFVLYSLIQISSPFTHLCMWIDSNLVVHDHYYVNLFIVTYIFCAFISLYMVIVYRRRFITRVRHCLQNIMICAFACMFAQVFFKQVSFVCVVFTFPIMAVLFLFHYNAYDTLTGTLDEKSLISYINDLRNKKFHIVALRLKDISEDDKKRLTEHFFHFNEKFFSDSCSFRIKDDRWMLVYPDKHNEKAKENINEYLQDFYNLYEKYKLDYKLFFVDSVEKISTADEYIKFCEIIDEKMEWNTIYEAKLEDIERFVRWEKIIQALKDIDNTQNLEDERVMVYCQPVLNTQTNKFTTAEALMRMEIADLGFVFPDEFIPLAEKYGYIHTLSKIILNKTCSAIKNFESKGYNIERISVNFSIIELRDDGFCKDVLKIIEDAGVNPEKIAIELTESKKRRRFRVG